MKASRSSVTNGLRVSERLVSNNKRVIEEEPLAMCSKIIFISFDNIFLGYFVYFCYQLKECVCHDN